MGILNLMFMPSGFCGKYPDVKPVSPPLMQAETSQPIIRNIAPGLFEVGGCKIDKAKHQVEFEAVVNMTQGILEYLIVNTAGKVHSSLLQTSVEPNVLQFALMMIGLNGTVNPLKERGESSIPEGDAVKILTVWDENGKDRTILIEQLILKQGNAIEQMPWVFTGSNNAVPEQAEKSIIAIYHDPAALLDHQLIEGNNNMIWSVNSDMAPPAGTLVHVMIQGIAK